MKNLRPKKTDKHAVLDNEKCEAYKSRKIF